ALPISRSRSLLRADASSTAVQSAALACTTKLRVNRPQSLAARRAAASCESSAEPVSDRQDDDGGGEVRPNRDRTGSPRSPATAAFSTSPTATGKRYRRTASSAPASPAVPPYIADNRAILARPRSPPKASAARLE